MAKVFVFGWYGHGNLGDEAFKPAFKELWPKSQFTFGDKIPPNINTDYDVCLIGGGSFLDQKIEGLSKVNIPLGFIGVGVHDVIHPDNATCLAKAKIIVSRNPFTDTFLWGKDICFEGSDLVFSRNIKTNQKLNRRMVMMFLNHFVVQNTPSWKREAYQNFIENFPKICDQLVNDGYSIVFFPFCKDLINDDRLLAFKIVAEMKSYHAKETHILAESDEDTLFTLLPAAQYCVSMRYHGTVFSMMAGVPCLTLTSHDKMKSLHESLQSKSVIDYYGITPQTFSEGVKNLDSSETFLEYSRKEKEKWASLSAIIGERLKL